MIDDAVRGVGEALLAQAKPAEAIGLLERTLAIREAAGARPREMSEAHRAMARAIEKSGGDPARAREHAAAAQRAGNATGVFER